MKGRVVLLDQWAGRSAAALMVDGRLDDVLVDPPQDAPSGPGATFRAVVDRQVKGQGGVFVRLPGAERGFLRQARGLSPGDCLIVQVTGFSEPGKAIPVTDNVLFKSRYCIVTPGKPGINIARSLRDEEKRDALLELAHEVAGDSGYGLILRSSSGTATEDDIAEDMSSMLALADAVAGETRQGPPELLLDGPAAHLQAWRDWADPTPDEVIDAPGCFEDHGALDALEELASPLVELSAGASFFVEPTRALVAVDVNTGGDTSPAGALKANLATARALPRALRLRGLGGQITIDFAPLAKKDRRQVEQALKSAFRADAVDTVLVGWTPLGHFELQRKRERLVLAGGA